LIDDQNLKAMVALREEVREAVHEHSVTLERRHDYGDPG
jgi:hypothetical protein